MTAPLLQWCPECAEATQTWMDEGIARCAKHEPPIDAPLDSRLDGLDIIG